LSSLLFKPNLFLELFPHANIFPDLEILKLPVEKAEIAITFFSFNFYGKCSSDDFEFKPS
jgi:hypothetical protein